MADAVKIERGRLFRYFDAFTKRFLRDDSPEAVDVEVMDPEIGDQIGIQGTRLIGITFDPNTDALELALEPGDHRVYHPAEVWVVEEDDGFLSAIEVARPDGGHEVVSVKRGGLRRLD
jgi:hypothetical protein